ncbi:MAG: type II secretion system protein [Planctomycetes bacterium]|nr:type II secretion system protein [Planctomycetota bacterium]
MMHKKKIGGFTLIELIITISILVTVILFLIGSMATSWKVNTNTIHTNLALNEARTKIEELQDSTFSQIYAEFNTDTLDDPNGTGTSPGSNFDVSGLYPSPLDNDGKVGRIFFPTIFNEVTNIQELREDLQDASLGMPMDLNGDGVIDSNNHANDYKILPIRIEIKWDEDGREKMHFLTTIIGQ